MEGNKNACSCGWEPCATVGTKRDEMSRRVRGRIKGAKNKKQYNNSKNRKDGIKLEYRR